MTLEQACGLHERVSFLYVVDGYLCSLTDHEGMRELFTAKGGTMQEAMDKLAELVRPYSSKEEMKRAAQTRIEAEAFGARVWQAGREVSMIPDLEIQKEGRTVRARLSSGKPSVQNIDKSEVAQGIHPLIQKEHVRRVKGLEAVQEQLMVDIEDAVNEEMTVTDQCGRCGRFYLAGRDHDCMTDHD